MNFEELKTKYQSVRAILDWFAEDYVHSVASGKIEEWKEMLALFSTVVGHELPEIRTAQPPPEKGGKCQLGATPLHGKGLGI